MPRHLAFAAACVLAGATISACDRTNVDRNRTADAATGAAGAAAGTPEAGESTRLRPPAGDALLLTPGPDLPKHAESVVAAAISADGQRVATVGRDGKLKISSAVTGKLEHDLAIGIPEFSFHLPGGHVAFAPGGKLLAATVDNRVRLFDPASGKLENTLGIEGPAGIMCLRFTPSGDRLVALEHKKVIVWSIPKGSVAASFEIAEPAKSFVITPDGKSLVAAGPEKSVAFYDLADGRVTRRLEGTVAEVEYLAINAEGTLLARSDNGPGFAVYDLRTGNPRITGKIGANRSLAFTPDGLLAKGYYLLQFDLVEENRTFILATCRMTQYAEAREPSFSADARRFVFCDGVANQGRLYRMERSQELRSITGSGAIHGAAVSPDGKRLAYVDDGSVVIFSLAEGRVEKSAPLKPESGDRHQLEFSPDGKWLARSVVKFYDNEFEIYDAATLDRKAYFKPQRAEYSDACFSADGASLLLVGSEPRTWDFSADKLSPWELEFDGKKARLLRGAENRLFVYGYPNRMTVYDWPARRILHTWLVGREVDDFAVSPDGRRVATYYSSDRNVLVWDVSTGKLEREIVADTEGVTAAAFSADGGRLIAAGREPRLSIWSTDDGRLTATCPGHHEANVDEIRLVPGTSQFITTSGLYVRRPAVKLWDLSTLPAYTEAEAPSQPPAEPSKAPASPAPSPK